MGLDKSKWAKHKKAMKKDWQSHASAQRKSFDMPGPIRGGVARLKDIEFKEWESDEGTVDIVEITGVIVTPSEHKGKEVRVSHFLQDSQYSTVEECYNNVMCDFKAMGIDVADFDGVDAEIEKAIKAHAAFTFNTKIAKKSKRIFCELVGPAVLEKPQPKVEEPKAETPKAESAPWSDDADPFA